MNVHQKCGSKSLEDMAVAIAIAGHFDPAVGKQLRQLALDNDTTVQALLEEALNDLFLKHGKSPIA
jgi:hypothetical protein